MTEKRPSDERKKDILEAALRCYAKKGYHATTMDDITKESGLTKGGIYWHFKSKWDIFLGILVEHKKVHQKLWDKLEEMGLTASTLSQGGLLFLKEHITNDWISKICCEIEVEAMRNAEILKHYLDIQKNILGDVKKKLEEARQLGLLGPVNTESLAYVIYLVIDGLTRNYSILDKQLDYEKIWMDFAEYLANGILKKVGP